MKVARLAVLLLVIWPFPVSADVNKQVSPLSCGIYDQQIKPFIQRDLATQSANKADYTMEITTARGKRLSVEVKSVEIKLPGERAQVSVFLDGKPLAKTSHQDVPIYLEVHVDDVKYRIVCVRTEPVQQPEPKPEPTTDQNELSRRQEQQSGSGVLPKPPR